MSTSQMIPLFRVPEPSSPQRTPLGAALYMSKDKVSEVAHIYQVDQLFRKVDIRDKTAVRVFLVDAVELGAKKSWLADAFGITRQTLHNYVETKKHFGMEGLINGYNPNRGKSSRQAQRRDHADKLNLGNKAAVLREMRKAEHEKKEQEEQVPPLSHYFEEEDRSKEIAATNQVFWECHGWKASRYAGTFIYLPLLISKWKWLELVQGFYGEAWRIFMVFLLMAAQNIRSIEGLKNVSSREAGRILGIRKILSKPTVWSWFYEASAKRLADGLLKSYFTYQLRAGIVSFWLWASDGHLLPYTGKERVRHSYNTQRQMPVPGQTSIVTCDEQGRVVDFVISEGKGDLRGQIIELAKKWKKECPSQPIMVFDREGSGAPFFYQMVKEKISFCTWEKNVDASLLKSITEEEFLHCFSLNDKEYGCFEREKLITLKTEGSQEDHPFVLREIVLWNKTSNRRTCGLAWTGDRSVSTEECAKAILTRWGASENTFKHIAERHPFHYHPGFSTSKSPNQQIANPLLKEVKTQIGSLKGKIKTLFSKLARKEEALNQDGSVRKNSVKARVEAQITMEESRLAELQKRRSELPEKVDASSLENYGSIQEIDNEGKYLFDFVTCSVWNARKMMVDWLKSIYGNENDVVDLFYAITACHGWIKSTDTEVVVRLEALEQQSRRAAQEALCLKLNNLFARTPGGKLLTVEVGLADSGKM
jgi:hypothetical protein